MHVKLATVCFYEAGEKGFEPLTFGFGDHCSTIGTTLLCLKHTVFCLNVYKANSLRLSKKRLRSISPRQFFETAPHGFKVYMKKQTHFVYLSLSSIG